VIFSLNGSMKRVLTAAKPALSVGGFSSRKLKQNRSVLNALVWPDFVRRAPWRGGCVEPVWHRRNESYVFAKIEFIDLINLFSAC
jgi:hypothetical protein